MKNSILLLCSVLFFSPLSYSQNKADVVLGISLDPETQQFHFPCSAYSIAVFCNGSVRLKDAACEKSLKFVSVGAKSMDIICTTSQGRKVQLARAKGELIEDTTQDAFGYVPVQLTSEGESLIITEK